MQILTATLSEPGGKLPNEDSICWHVGGCVDEGSKQFCVWALADGLGGHSGGQAAARLVTEQFVQGFQKEPTLRKGCVQALVEQANDRLVDEQMSHGQGRGMKSTLVALMSDGDSAIWCHVGDSRLYFFRNGRILHQTEDHSLSQFGVLVGEIGKEDIRHHQDRNKLLRCLGSEGHVRATIPDSTERIMQGDAFLLCSDGFWENILEDEMEKCLQETSSATGWLDSMTGIIRTRLDDKADNLSAVCVRITEGGAGGNIHE